MGPVGSRPVVHLHADERLSDVTGFSASERVMAVPDLVTEPLVGNFYAWLQCISPVTSALRLAGSQIPTLESYLESPEDHAEAAADPGLRGGQFVDAPKEDFEAIGRLLDELAADREMLGLASAVRELSGALDDADGQDLLPLYERVPTPLRGLVELTYDHRQAAHFRLLEPLAYRRYNPARRQAVYISRAETDVRPFILSTPRLSSDRGIVARVPLDSPGVGTLIRSRFAPVRYGDLVAELGLSTEEERVLQRFFVPGPSAPRAAPPARRGVRVRYFGHACVLIETEDVTVLVDPFISVRPGDDRYSFADLPPVIDYCLITHGHADHLVLETLLSLRHRIHQMVVPRSNAGQLVDPSIGLCLRQLGFTDVREIGECESIELPDGLIVSWPFRGEHGDLPVAAKTTYFVSASGRTFYFGADTRASEPATLEALRAEYGPVEDVFIGMECAGAPLTWVYGPLFPKPMPRPMALSRRLNGCDSAEALAALRALEAKRGCVYAMGEEPWLQHVIATNYNAESPQLREVAALERAGSAVGIEIRHLYGKFELPAR
jgi:L-ascorbate metabolism protein UlaG (beta-lactamase superfamily)